MRVPIVVRDGTHARLLAFDDSVWRRPLHSGKESCDGPLTADSHAISGRLAVPRTVPRFGGRSSVVATGAGEGRSLLHQHARGSAAGATNSATPAQGYEADRHDHRRQALRAHTRRRAHIQKRVRPRPAGCQPDARRSFEVQTGGRADQYLHAGVGLWTGAVRPEGNADVPRQGLLHDALYARPVFADGLHVAKDEDDSLVCKQLTAEGKSRVLHSFAFFANEWEAPTRQSPDSRSKPCVAGRVQ